MTMTMTRHDDGRFLVERMLFVIATPLGALYACNRLEDSQFAQDLVSRDRSHQELLSRWIYNNNFYRFLRRGRRPAKIEENRRGRWMRDNGDRWTRGFEGMRLDRGWGRRMPWNGA